MAAGAAGMLTGCQTSIPVTTPESTPLAGLTPEKAAFSEALARYSEGLIHEYRDEFDAALTNYQAAIALDPDNEDLYLRMAMGLLHQKKNAEAVALIESLAERKPNSQKALLWLALIYRATGQTDQVERIYNRLIRIDASSPSPYIELASLYLKNGDDKKAVRILEDGLDEVTTGRLDLLRILGDIYFRQANTAAAKGEDRKSRRAAIHVLEQALHEAPDDVTILFQLGDVYILDRQIEKAVECFEKIEAKHPDNLQVKQKLALSFVALGDKDKAIETLENMAEQRPDSGNLYYYLGELYKEKGDQEKAILNFRFASKARKTDPSPFLKIALMQLDKNPEDSIQTLQDGLEQIPGNIRLTEMLAYVYFSKKEYVQAVTYFEKTRDLLSETKPEAIPPYFYVNFAVACQRAGRTEQAAAMLTKAVEANPAFLDAYVQHILQQKDDNLLATTLPILEKLALSMPEDPSVYLYLGLMHHYSKEYTQALAVFEKAEALTEDSPEKEASLNADFYFWYGAACERNGQFDRAILNFRKCIAKDPDQADALNYLSYMWAERNTNLTEALSFIQRALDIEPDNGAFVDTLGWIHYMRGEYDKAYEQVKKAAELVPDDSTVVEHLGDIQMKLGQPAEALENWKKSFRFDTGNTNVASKLKLQGVDTDALRKEFEQLKSKEAAPAIDRKPTAGNGVEVPFLIAPSDAFPDNVEEEPPEEDLPEDGSE